MMPWTLYAAACVALVAAICIGFILSARRKGAALLEDEANASGHEHPHSPQHDHSPQHEHPPPAHFRDYKFCPLCASRLELRHICDRQRLACSAPGCRFVHWDNPKPVAVVLVDVDSSGPGPRKVVLTRRRYPPQVGTWCLPGGFVEAHEDAELAAAREVFEETGLEVEITGLIGVYSPDLDANEVIVAYSARLTGGALNAGEEVLEVGQFTSADLPADIGFQKHREIIHNWFKSLD